MSGPDGRSRTDEILKLREELGWNIVPAAARGKTPIGAWKQWQQEVAPDRMIREARHDCNWFLITGSISCVCVLDCDDEAALAYWVGVLGKEALAATAQVRTGNGAHFYFRLAPGQTERGRSSAGGDQGKWDLRAEGGGVVVPPSTHPSGREYRWVKGRGPGALKEAPDALFGGVAGERDTVARSQLSELISNPPAEGGRNMWLTKVAGHYAAHIPHRDAFEAMVRDAADKLSPPLPEEEIVKMLESIWTTEQAKTGRAVAPPDDDQAWRIDLLIATADTGWLVSGNNRILVQTRESQGKDQPYELKVDSWCDADLRVLGVVETEGARTYEVEVRRSNGELIEDSLPAEVAASPQRLPVWLANHGVTIGGPDNMFPARMRETTRLVRYLEAQKPNVLESVPYLGWHDESAAFITHDCVIRADGAVGFEGVRPNPALKNWAKYRYGGIDDLDRARDLLSRVLEFHDEEVVAVFGAWWAACLLKPQIAGVVSQFPFMALEAPSESGKTTGFFALMMELSGHYGGQTNPTTAALRDALSAHRSGITWLDDADDLVDQGELLRNVTVGGSMVKKGENNHSQVTATMRAALVVSGEGLGLHGQKALLDRAVLLSVPSPVGRLSRTGGPQWDDIVVLRSEHPDLTAVAGGVVRLALQQEHHLAGFKDLRGGRGRHADKLAVIKVGARILAGMVGGHSHLVERADLWCAEQVDVGDENALTLTIIPEVLALTGWKSKPEPPDESRRMVATPAFVDEDRVVWFSPMLLAQWLKSRSRGSVRLETEQALMDQARALDLGGTTGVDRKQFRFNSSSSQKSFYWRCTKELSEALLSRSEGANEREEHDGSNQGNLLQ